MILYKDGDSFIHSIKSMFVAKSWKHHVCLKPKDSCMGVLLMSNTIRVLPSHCFHCFGKLKVIVEFIHCFSLMAFR